MNSLNDAQTRVSTSQNMLKKANRKSVQFEQPNIRTPNSGFRHNTLLHSRNDSEMRNYKPQSTAPNERHHSKLSQKTRNYILDSQVDELKKLAKRKQGILDKPIQRYTRQIKVETSQMFNTEVVPKKQSLSNKPSRLDLSKLNHEKINNDEATRLDSILQETSKMSKIETIKNTTDSAFCDSTMR